MIETRTTGALQAAILLGTNYLGRPYNAPFVNNILGSRKSITGRWEGHYQPGILRLNPVTITQTLASCPDTRLTTIHPRYFTENIEIGPHAAVAYGIEGYLYRDQGFLDGSSWNSWMQGTSMCKAYSKLSSADWDSGIFAAEFREAIQMVRNPASAFVKHLANARRDRKLWRFTNMVAGSWLEARYGWTPLINDLKTAIAYFSQANDRILNQLERTRATVKYRKEYCRDFWTCFGDFTMYCSWRANFLYQVKCTSVLYYTLTRIKTWQEELGLTGDSLPSIIWEKIPFSFVVDWFVGIGSWLSAIQPTPWINNLGNTVSYVVSEDITVSSFDFSSNNGYILGEAPHSRFSRSERTLSRTTNNPMPALPPVNPRVQSVRHALDSLCLIWQRNKNLFRR